MIAEPQRLQKRPAAVYERDFGMRENPFRTNPNPRFTYYNTSTQEAIAQVQQCVDARLGLAVISGNIGTGKTTIMRIIGSELDDEQHHQVAAIENLPPARSQTESRIYRMIAEDLGLPNTDGRSAERAFASIRKVALETHEAGLTTVVMIDEAHLMKPVTVSCIIALNQITQKDYFPIQIVLFGQWPEMVDLIKSYPHLRSRVAIHQTLNPMTRDDVEKMVSHRIKVAGRSDAGLFGPATYDALFARSRGIPRDICRIAHEACVVAWSGKRDHVLPADVHEAATKLMAVDESLFDSGHVAVVTEA